MWIIKKLEENNVQYRISGGLAAQIYGYKRDLADIDIEVLEKDINKIYKQVKDFVIYGPAVYKDENWNLKLMTLKFQKQEIDIAAFEAKIFNLETKRWVKKPGLFTDVKIKKIFDLDVPVENIKSLIKYKKILNRLVDIQDVKELQKITKA